MAKMSVNKSGYDLYKNFRFHIKWNERHVAGVQKFSSFGGDRKGVPSHTRYAPSQPDDDPITLERGLSYDLEFQQWAKKSVVLAAGSGITPQDFQKEMVIEVYAQDGQLVTVYHVHHCWVSKFITLPNQGAQENEAVIDRIELQHQGWEQDPNLTGLGF